MSIGLLSMTPINSRSVISHMSCWSRTSSLALELEETCRAASKRWRISRRTGLEHSRARQDDPKFGELARLRIDLD